MKKTDKEALLSLYNTPACCKFRVSLIYGCGNYILPASVYRRLQLQHQ